KTPSITDREDHYHPKQTQTDRLKM
ncbi:uncharacterized protein METZ01_LOCUS238187, partial [marine metagenome]